MSRLGKRPISFGDKVKVKYNNREISVSGQKGNLNLAVPAGIELSIEGNSIIVSADYDTNTGKALGGTIRAVVNNMVTGVSEGFSKTLVLVGVGYRAQVSGKNLVLSLGYSHNIDYPLPETLDAEVKGNKVILTSCDKQLLGQVAAEIRKYRPPEPYKGKGILFEGERVLRKAGKTAKK